MRTVLLFSFGSLVDFSNRLKKTAIERLAEMDEHEVVREVQVYPAITYSLLYLMFRQMESCGGYYLSSIVSLLH